MRIIDVCLGLLLCPCRMMFQVFQWTTCQ